MGLFGHEFIVELVANHVDIVLEAFRERRDNSPGVSVIFHVVHAIVTAHAKFPPPAIHAHRINLLTLVHEPFGRSRRGGAQQGTDAMIGHDGDR